MLGPDWHGILIAPPGIKRERLAQFQHLALDARESVGLRTMLQSFGDPDADLAHFVFLNSACRDGGSPDADAARLHRRVSVERDRVLVDSDACQPERLF